MKKDLLRKLSLALGLAAMITGLWAASNVLASKDPSLNGPTNGKKYVHLTKPIKGKEYWFNFNVNDKPKGKGNTYTWISSKTDIATVNNRGFVYAKAPGTTTITCIITTKDGKTIKVPSKKLIVRDNIAKVSIKNPIKAKGKRLANTLVVGEEYDFNRSFESKSGSNKKTSGITRWTVEDDSGEEFAISPSGLVSLDTAGTYTVKAWSFQSKAKYHDWLIDDLKYKDYVTAVSEDYVFEVIE